MEEKIASSETEAVDYGRFKLKFNPFPMTAISVGGTPFPLYAPKADEVIKDFIVRTYTENHYAGMIVVGDYGFGKTYTLRWVEKRINEGYSQRNSEAACAIYIENPLSSPRELISAMISHYGINKYLTMLWGLVTHAFREKYENEGKEFLKQFRQRQLGLYDTDLVFELFSEARVMDPMRLLRRLCDELGKIRQFNLEKFSDFAYENVIGPIFGHTEIAYALSKFNANGFGASFRAWKALIEVKATKKSTHVGFGDVDFMRSILEVFKQKGYKRVYLLLDEFEDIHENLKKGQLSSYLRILRDCIDGNQGMIAIVLALKPMIVDRIQTAYGGFLHRFPFSYRIDLAGLMKDAIGEFLGKMLRSAREERFRDMGIQPFTGDGLKQIYEYTGPNPRLILQTCSDLLFEAAKAGTEAIDKDFVKNYYTTGKPSAAFPMEEVWITKKVEAKMKEEAEGEEK